MLIGALIVKLMQRYKLNNHRIIGGAALCLIAFLTLCTIFIKPLMLGIWMFFAGICFSAFEIIINICVLMIAHPTQV
jgi:hypothetical protein